MELGSQRGNYALAICTAVIFSFTSISQSRASQDSLCELMPIAVEQSVLAPLTAGDTVAELSIKQSEGNFGWLTWAGSPSSPVLAASLVLPGDSDTYINPDNASDHTLSIGDWAQGSPGVSGSNAVKAALNGLLNVPIVVPVWDQDRGQGNNFDYRVVKFATIMLTQYKLTGNGWLSFTYLGEKNCFASAPVAANLAYQVEEDQSVGVALSASDADNDPLTYSISAHPGHGQLSGTAPNLTYTPSTDFTGVDTFTYTANDGTLNSAPAIVTVTVLPVNDAPVAFNQQVEFDEDASVPIALQWQDVDGDTVTVTVLTTPLNGTLSGSGAQRTYTPNANFAGEDSFTFKVNDGQLDSNVATVLLTTNAVNDAPVSSNGSASTLEDEAVDIGLLSNDIDGDTLTYSVMAHPAHGDVQFLNDNTVRYQPAAGYFGTDQFTFFTHDGALDSNIATVTIEVTEKNRPPEIVSAALERATQRENYDYLVSAIDPNTNDSLSYSLALAPDTMAIDSASGQIAWTPDEHYVSGLDGVNNYCSLTTYDEQFRAADLVFLTATTGDVTLPATLLNAVTLSTEAALTALDIGSPGNPNRYGLLAFGSAVDPKEVDGEPMFPAADYASAASQLSAAGSGDADGLAALQAVFDLYALRSPVAKHFVMGVDDVPAAVDATAMAALTALLQTEDHTLSVIVDASFRCASGELAWGVDANHVGYLGSLGQTVHCENPVLESGQSTVLASYVELALASGGSVWNLAQLQADEAAFNQVFGDYLAQAVVERFSLELADLMIQAITLDPADPTQGTVVVRNRGLGAPGQSVNLAITGLSGGVEYPLHAAVVNDLGAAEAVAIPFTLPADHSFDSVSATLDALPGAIECVADNNTLTAPLVTVRVEDAGGLFDAQYYAITTVEANDSPQIISDPVTTAYIGEEYTYYVRASDPDKGDLLRFSLNAAPDGMWIHPVTGKLTWTPLEANRGDVVIEVRAIDIEGSGVVQSFTLSVGDFNHAPDIITTAPLSATLGQLYFYDVNAVDADGDTLHFTLLDAPAGATINATTGEIQWSAEHPGVVSFSVQVGDGRGGFDSQQFLVTVVDGASNAAPVALPGSYQTPQNQLVDITLTGQDPNGDVLGFTVVVAPQHGTLVGSGADVQYLPDNFYAGNDSFQFTVDDGSLGSLPAVVTVDVQDENNAPYITSEPELPFVLEPATGQGQPVNLSTWTVVDLGVGSQPAANWVLSSGNTVVTQTVNARASVFLSDFGVNSEQIAGNWRVSTNEDDDFIGFVFGWQNPYQFYLFDWKENTQDGALRGMTVKVINLAPDGSEGKPALWDTYNPGITTLFHNSIRWNSFTDYDFSLTYHPGEFTITVKQGATVLSSITLQDDTFPSGGFGFYNYSQNAVRYRDFTREALASREYIYNVQAVDPDGDAITYTLLDGPDGMTLDAATGQLTWQTTSQDAGTYPILIQVADPAGATAVQRYDLVVVEEVPVIVTSPAEEALADQPYIYDVGAHDPNPDDVLAFSLTQSPAGMSIVAQSGVISWTPTAAQLGPHNVTVRVTDPGGFFSEQPYVLSVVEALSNVAPVFTSQAPATAQVGSTYRYTPTATDGDGDPVSFSLIDVPAGMRMFDGQTITWTPTANQVTQHTVVIEVSDGRGGATEQTFTINVAGAGSTTHSNNAPHITSQPGQTIQTGGDYEYRVLANDVDGDTLSYQLVNGPIGMTMDALGVLRWMPVATGYYDVTVRVEDGHGGYATQSYEIVVRSTVLNAAPAITSSPIGAAYLGARYDYRLVATDADGDALVYSVVTGPAGLTIDPYTGVVNWVPTQAQLGDHSVALRAYDGRGGSIVQSFTLRVLALSTNLPPRITSTPLTSAPLGALYTYQLTAQDPEGSAVTFTLDGAPAGMQLDASGLVTWQPLSGQEGRHTVVLKANDGAGGTATQTYTLAVDDGTGLLGNLAPVISSTPGNQVTAGALYQYAVAATDPEGAALSYQLVLAPPGMSISGSGLVTWTPQGTNIGSHTVLIEVSDGQGASTQQYFTLSVLGTGGNQTPQITSQPSTSAKVGLVYSAQIAASDANGDALSYSLTISVAGASISPTGLLTWTPTAAGPQPMTVRVSDGIAWTDLSWTINVAPASTELGAVINITPDVANAGTPVTVQVIPTGSAGAASASITLDGANVALNASNTAVVSSSTIGAHIIAARVADAYDTVTVYKTFYIRDPNDVTVPVATINNIQAAQEITVPVDIIATISDANLASWRLNLISLSDPANPVELASGTTAVNNAVIAQLDPTLLINGQYTLQLEALDASRNTGVDAEHVRVTGDMKVGNFSFTLTDLDIPVSGIPIQINRTYDSRQRQQNLDFGFGWSLDYQNVKLEESRRLSSGWALNEYRSGPMNAVVDFCVEPVGKPLVTVTLPSGQVDTFEVQANPGCRQFQAITDVNFKFVPIDGTTSTLTQSDFGTLRLAGGKLVELGGDQQPDPDLYTLTTKAGYVYVIDQAVGLKTVTDPNGNTLTYTDNGIFHSDGKSVVFERNGNGQIDAIVDPMGQRYEYVRDANGDLISATDPETAQSTYTYNGSHGLLEMFDPLGRKLLKNLYNDDGRLIAQEDGEGNRTEFDHDIEGRQSLITDRNGHLTQLFYDAQGNVTTRVDAENNSTTFTYDAVGNQLSQTNAFGDTSSATFNTRRDQLTQTDELGNTVRFTYNTRGQELTVKDARNNTYTQTYDGKGNLLTVKDPLNNIAGNNIDIKGRVSLTQDVAGNITRFTYDSQGNKLTERDAEGHTTTFTYDDNGNVLTESRVRGGITETTTYTYDARDRLTSTTDAQGNVTTTEYDLAGNQSATVDGEGKRTEYQYDAYGRLTLTTFSDSTTESNGYDPEGNRISSTDRLGRTTSYVYDPLNRLIKTAYPDNSFTQTEYDELGRVSAEIDERGNRTEHAYDAAGRKVATTDAQNNVHRYEYDADGNLTAEVDALNRRTEYTYNALDQRTTTRYHDGTTMTEVQDAVGRKTRMTDQAGITTQYAYDGLGRLTKVTDALNQETSYTYDAVGNKLTQTDAEGRTTSWTYDALGREATRTLPLGQSESLGYDAVGNLTNRTDFNGQVTGSIYDDNHRLSVRTFDDGSSETYTYDAVGNLLTVVQTAADSSTRTTGYTYDQRDRLKTHSQPNGAILTYGYDLAGNRTSVQVDSPTGDTRTTTYAYDSLNRLQSVTDANGQTTYGYDAVGNMTSVSHPNGTSQVYGYDVLNRLTNLKTYDGTGALIEGYTYTLDPTGRRTQINELDGRSTTYGYDDLYRLTSETITDTTNGNYSATYQYDDVGNRTLSTIQGVTTAYSVDANDRLTQQGGTTYTFDDNGNTLTETLDGVTTTYNYDAKDRLTSVDKGGVTTSYTYAHSGIRDSKTNSGTTTGFVIDANRDYTQVLEEVTNNTSDVIYSYGHDLLSQERAGTSSFYHYDGLGSVRSLSNASGAQTDSYHYEGFGVVLNETGTTENAYMFTGEQYDENLNQYYLRSRYYDQTAGRFTQMDSWMGINTRPKSLNKYSYAELDPTNHVDPSGKFIGSLSTAQSIGIVLATTTIAAYEIGQSLVDADLHGGQTTPSPSSFEIIPWQIIATTHFMSKLSESASNASIADARQRTRSPDDVHHTIPIYLCGSLDQNLSLINRSQHAMLHSGLALIEVAKHSAEAAADRLTPFSRRRSDFVMDLAQSPAGRKAIAGSIQSYYQGANWWDLGTPTIGTIFPQEKSRFIAGHTSLPECSRKPIK